MGATLHLIFDVLGALALSFLALVFAHCAWESHKDRLMRPPELHPET